METLKNLDAVASQLLQKLPELMNNGTLYANDLFQRFITYSLWVQVIDLFAVFIFAIVLCIGFKKTYLSVLNGSYDDDNFPHELLYFFMFCVGLALFAFMMTDIMQVIKIINVPELYLIDYFK